MSPNINSIVDYYEYCCFKSRNWYAYRYLFFKTLSAESLSWFGREEMQHHKVTPGQSFVTKMSGVPWSFFFRERIKDTSFSIGGLKRDQK